MASSLRRRTVTGNGRSESESLATNLQQTINQQHEDEHEGYDYGHNPSLADIDQSMRSASLLTVGAWLALLIVAYFSVADVQCEKLQGAERISALIAFVLLSGSLILRALPLVLQMALPITRGPTAGAFLFDSPTYVSGIVVGGVTTQLIAIATDAAMAFGHVPVLIDPVLGHRVSLLRWAEFTTLAFLMTFLTEAFGVQNKHKINISTPMLHALCQSLATFVGLLFPYCHSRTVWYTLLVISCCLFSVIFPRLYYKQTQFTKLEPGRTFQEAMFYDRARLSLKMLKACTICWTLFPLLFFLSGFVFPAIFPPTSLFRDPAIPMVFEAALDVLSKLVQMNIVVDVHTGVFDDQDSVRALQRLHEVKDAIGEHVWDTAQDVILISVRQEISGRVTSMVSPAACWFPNKTEITTRTEALVFALAVEQFHNMAQQHQQQHHLSHAVRPLIVTGGSIDATKLAALASLVVRAWNQTELPQTTLQHTVGDCSCQVEVTRLEDHLMVVVVQGLE